METCFLNDGVTTCTQVILEHLQEMDAGPLMRGMTRGSDHAHSDAAFGMLEEFHIGTLNNSSRYSHQS